MICNPCLDFNVVTNSIDVNCNLNVTGSITGNGEPVGSAVYLSSYGSTSQSIPTATLTAVTYGTNTLVNWGTQSSTSVFTPPVPGTYLVNVNAYWTSVPASGTTKLLIQKNSTTVSEQIWLGALDSETMHVATVVPMNGTTDTITTYLYQSTSTSQTSGGVADGTYYGNNIQIDRLHA